MAKIKLELKEEHLKLVRWFKVKYIDDYNVGFDRINPYEGQHLMEDLAMIFGYWDKAIEGTELDYDGRKFGYEIEKEMLDYHIYVVDNFKFILSIMTQYIETGVKPGKYTAIDTVLNWTYKPF